jgi:hypothetical protein
MHVNNETVLSTAVFLFWVLLAGNKHCTRSGMGSRRSQPAFIHYVIPVDAAGTHQ